MTAETLTIIVSLVAVVIAGIAIWQARQNNIPITGELVQATLATSTTMAQELTAAGLAAARAAQQLFESGKITRDERLDKAFAYVRQFFPHLDQERIIMAIEAGVFVVNSAVAALPDKPSDAGTALPTPTPPPYGTYTGTPPDKPLILGR